VATLKIVLKNQKKDGTYPLAIRVTKNRRPTYIFLDCNSIKESDWDAEKQRVRKSHPNSTRLNNFLIAKLAEATTHSLELETQNKAVNSATIKSKNNAANTPDNKTSFFKQAQVYLENLKTSGKYNVYVSEEGRVRVLREFAGNKKDLSFEEITIPFLNKLKAYLKGVRNVKERTVMNYFVFIRTIYNQAISARLVDRSGYPFGKDGISIRFPDSNKIGLTMEDVKTLETLDLSDNPFHHHARNVWLLSFYFAGIRVGDSLLLKWSDFRNERLYYSMNKNGKAGSLKLSDKALSILKQYESGSTPHDLVFPDLAHLNSLDNLYDVQRKTSYAVKRLDDALKEIAKKAGWDIPLTMHIARHTFGNISGDKIPVQMLQKLYRHSNITTTIGYQANFINKDADDALEAVIGN